MKTILQVFDTCPLTNVVP